MLNPTIVTCSPGRFRKKYCNAYGFFFFSVLNRWKCEICMPAGEKRTNRSLDSLYDTFLCFNTNNKLSYRFILFQIRAVVSRIVRLHVPIRLGRPGGGGSATKFKRDLNSVKKKKKPLDCNFFVFLINRCYFFKNKYTGGGGIASYS